MANMENLCIFYCNIYTYIVENVSPPLNIPYHSFSSMSLQSVFLVLFKNKQSCFNIRKVINGANFISKKKNKMTEKKKRKKCSYITSYTT